MTEHDDTGSPGLLSSETSQRFHPSLSAATPPDWYTKESVTLLAPDGQANVIVSTEPLDASIDAEQYARVQGDLLVKEFPGYREANFAEVGIEGLPLPVYLREFSWTPPDGVEVTQLQLYAATVGRGMTATATTPTSQYPRYREHLWDILRSVVFEPAQPASSAPAPRQRTGV